MSIYLRFILISLWGWTMAVHTARPEVLVGTSLPQAAQSPQSESRTKALTVDDITAMLEAGLSEELIITQLRKAAQAFDLSVQEIVNLKKKGASDNIIKIMINPSAEITSTSSGTNTTGTSGSQGSGKTDDTDGLPDEVGLYVRLDGKLVEIQPEIVTWRTGGFLKAMATGGLTKGHVNGKIQRSESTLKLFPPVEFVVRCPEGVSAAEYQLLRLDKKSDRREFRALTGGIIHASSGAEKNALPFEFDKMAPRTFLVKVNDLKQGEYGFLPPGAYQSASAASLGKIYTFRIPE
ncbi:MAG: hypothetical protein AB1898_18805 [Acidobacteriota bacterium]